MLKFTASSLLFAFSTAALALQPAPSNMTSYRGQNGKTITVQVTGASSGLFWGGSGNLYTDDSSLAAAAVHAGLVRPGQTAAISVTVLPGLSSYPSISRNGLTSIKYGKWHGSYRLSAAGTPVAAQPAQTAQPARTPQPAASPGQQARPASSAGSAIPIAPDNVKKHRGYNGNCLTFRVRGSKTGKIWGGADYYYTDDSDIATAARHAGVVPLGEWGIVRLVIRPGRSSYSGINRNGILSQNYGSYAGSFQILTGEAAKIPVNSGYYKYAVENGFEAYTAGYQRPGKPAGPAPRPEAKPGPQAAPAAPSSIPAPGNMTAYRGQNGKVFTVRVTGSSSGRFWGGSGNVYTDDSSLAAAAVHAGILAPGQTGTIRVSVLPGRDSYPSITRNGLTSTKYGKWHGSYQILGTAQGTAPAAPAARPAAPAAPSAIPAPANMTAYRGQNGKTLLVRVTGASSGRFWGGSGNVYTDDSSLAAAAVHAGLVAPGQTAVIRVTVLPGRDSYPSISRNGLTSIKYGKWHGSYSLSR